MFATDKADPVEVLYNPVTFVQTIEELFNEVKDLPGSVSYLLVAALATL
jgi:hypothetical protein